MKGTFLTLPRLELRAHSQALYRLPQILESIKASGRRSWYSDWLRTERLRGRGSSPSSCQIFVPPCRRARLGAQPAYPIGTGGKAAGA
jgi:hypothetical protein